MAHGFMYLVAIMDWYSRYVLAWRLSNTLDSGFCVDALEEALGKGTPGIFNADQGSQFTGEAFTGVHSSSLPLVFSPLPLISPHCKMVMSEVS